MTALFKDGEELGVVSGFDVVSGCWCCFDIVIVDVCDDVDDDADKVGRGPGWEPVHCRPTKEATDAEPP